MWPAVDAQLCSSHGAGASMQLVVQMTPEFTPHRQESPMVGQNAVVSRVVASERWTDPDDPSAYCRLLIPVIGIDAPAVSTCYGGRYAGNCVSFRTEFSWAQDVSEVRIKARIQLRLKR